MEEGCRNMDSSVPGRSLARDIETESLSSSAISHSSGLAGRSEGRPLKSVTSILGSCDLSCIYFHTLLSPWTVGREDA